VTHVAYGVKQPHILLMLLAVLPGLIAAMILTRRNLTGQSASGITVLQIKGMNNLGATKAMHFSKADLAAFAGVPAQASPVIGADVPAQVRREPRFQRPRGETPVVLWIVVSCGGPALKPAKGSRHRPQEKAYHMNLLR